MFTKSGMNFLDNFAPCKNIYLKLNVYYINKKLIKNIIYFYL